MKLSIKGSDGHAVTRTPPLFGEVLSLVLAPSGIPLVVEDTITFLQSQGLTVEGLFRVPASEAKLEKLKRMYDSGIHVSKENFGDAHTAAGVLKRYLHELKEPVMSSSLYSSWIACANMPEEDRNTELTRLVDELPQISSRTLGAIFEFLNEVSKHESENRMTVDNLALIFSPSLLRKDENAYDMMQTYRDKHIVIKSLIMNYDSIFPRRCAPSLPEPFEDLNQENAENESGAANALENGMNDDFSQLKGDSIRKSVNTRYISPFSHDPDRSGQYKHLNRADPGQEQHLLGFSHFTKEVVRDNESGEEMEEEAVHIHYPKWPEERKFMISAEETNDSLMREVSFQRKA